MTVSPWRLRLRLASFNGVEFHVDVDAKSGGRRNALHEFPKRDIPYAEDMGRRARRFSIAAYVIGPDYVFEADDLVAELEREGPGLLIHPTMGEDLVNVDTYSRTERRERGGIAEFEITFMEAGEPTFTSPLVDTVSTAIRVAQSAISSFQSSSDIAAVNGAPVQ